MISARRARIGKFLPCCQARCGPLPSSWCARHRHPDGTARLHPSFGLGLIMTPALALLPATLELRTRR